MIQTANYIMIKTANYIMIKKKLSQYESFINMETLCNLGFVHESF